MKSVIAPSVDRATFLRSTTAIVAAASLGAAASVAPARAAAYHPVPLSPRQKVRLGLLSSSSDSGLLIAYDRGYFSDEGLDVEKVPFRSLTVMVPFLGTGQLDVAAGGLAAGLFNSAARDVPLRIVADKGHLPGPRARNSKGGEADDLMVRKDLITSGKVRDYADLRGLKIALPGGPGSAGEFSLARALANAKLQRKDVDIVTMGYPDLVAAFANGSIDAANVIEPFVTLIESQGTAVIWKTNTDMVGHTQQIAIIVYGESFTKRQDAARRFMIAYIRGIRDYYDAFGPKHLNYNEVTDIMAKGTGEANPRIYDDIRPMGLDPDGKLSIQSLQEQLDYFTQAGLVESKVDLHKLVDSSYAEYAVSQLGPLKR
jgi:NitT/TauT family transport system substrate-binding protein